MPDIQAHTSGDRFVEQALMDCEHRAHRVYVFVRLLTGVCLWPLLLT